MVIKSSETKVDQAFLELYKKLSKEVVSGGEKLLKEIQNELSEYKNCGLSAMIVILEFDSIMILIKKESLQLQS